jgi:Tol biopolymer transport system component
MFNWHRILIVLLGAVTVWFFFESLWNKFISLQSASVSPSVSQRDIVGSNHPALTDAYRNLPMTFEKNQGQVDPRVKFISRGSGYNLFLTPDEAVLALNRPVQQDDRSPIEQRHVRDKESPQEPDVIRMSLLGANSSARLDGIEHLEGKANYFIGNNPANWRREVPLYSGVQYQGVYPGIDLLFRGDGNELEYDFLIAPTGNPNLIRLHYSGATEIDLDPGGNLIIHTERGQVQQKSPSIYQLEDGLRKNVGGRYVLRGEDEVGIEIDNYDASKTLVIDPTLVYSTYLGGSSDDVGYSVAVDAQGSAYVTGRTLSANFPVSNPFHSTTSGGHDVVVTKLNAAGSGIIYSTYVGGAADDVGTSIALNSSGEAYVTGYTKSTNFPIANGLQTSYGGGLSDAFLFRLSATGNSLLYCTYSGGNGEDVGTSIALDSSRNIYGIGYTTSTNLPAVNAIQPFNAGGYDAYLIELAPSGTAITFSTYAGGSGTDYGNGITVDSAGYIYAIGDTSSTNLPTVNALQPFNAGGFDAFLAKLTPSGSSIVFSTYAGGNGTDSGDGIAIDGSGNICTVGYTNSTNLALIVNAVQPSKSGGYDAFVAKLNSTGNAVQYSTFLGGTGDDFGYSIAADSNGYVYVIGVTSSFDYPLVNPVRSYSGGRDVFITKLWPSGSTILFSTCLGGSSDDYGFGIAADESGSVYVTGTTSSTNFSTVSPIQPARGGGLDMFLAKLTTGTTTAGAKIVFGSSRNNRNHDIYLMDTDGSNQIRITSNTAYDDQPKWSPDGRKIAFISNRDGNFEIYSMNADGTGQTRLTNNSAADGFPAWSPDGKKIAFVSGDLKVPSTYEIYVMNADGSNRTRLTNDSLIDATPSWSPDGSKIVFMSGSSSIFDPNSFDIYVMNADGSNRTRLTNNAVMDAQPSYSPDGTKIVYASGNGFIMASIEIYVMDANGGNPTQLTNNFVTDGFPVWSPDGKKIVFASGKTIGSQFLPFDETNVELSMMNADGSNQTRLTNNSVLDWFPDWQPQQGASPTPTPTATPTPANAIDDATFFVKQHYLDFLNRQPDQSGWDFWTNQITSCGIDAQCVQVRRVNTSGAFFLSIEFQQTGYLVERTYKSAYGDAAGTSTLGGAHQLRVPIVRFNQLIADTQEIGSGVIVNQGNWQQQLENNKQAFMIEFVQRSQFGSAFPSAMTPAQFVDQLNVNAGNVLSATDRSTAIALFSGAANSSNVTARAQALRQIAENANLSQAEFNRAFVLMQYLGYLRRDPNSGADTDYTGYDFWLSKLNQFNGDYIAAEMVKAFISSSEYRQRFGP